MEGLSGLGQLPILVQFVVLGVLGCAAVGGAAYGYFNRGRKEHERGPEFAVVGGALAEHGLAVQLVAAVDRLAEAVEHANRLAEERVETAERDQLKAELLAAIDKRMG